MSRNSAFRQTHAGLRRVLTVAWRRRPIGLAGDPDFFIIGAQKAGTSSLYRWLCAHPHVRSARTKELQFFDDPNYRQNLARYRRMFPSNAQRRLRTLIGRSAFITGEATPYYMFHPHIAGRIAAEYPNAKIIMSLRDPSERAVSHYWHTHRLGGESLSLMEALHAEDERLAPELALLDADKPSTSTLRDHSYASRGMYADQIRRWRALFPPEQLLLIEFRNLVESPATVVATCLDFLGLNAPRDQQKYPARNVFDRPAADEDALRWLDDKFRDANADLHELTGIDYRNGELRRRTGASSANDVL